MPKTHNYFVTVTWTGNTGTGTSGYKAYDRRHEISASQKPAIPGSSDPAFRGDPARWTPEDLLVAAVSACHKLWYLHLCATEGIVVTAYVDHASGTMEESADGSGKFVEVTLHPTVTISGVSDRAKAESLHHDAHQKCFIANSVNFPIHCRPEIVKE